MSTREPILQDGEADIGPHANLWHRDHGMLQHRPGWPHPPDGAVFDAPQIDGPGTVRVAYTVAELAEAWEDVLFDSPYHAKEVLGGEDA
jgi:hypothetical protein